MAGAPVVGHAQASSLGRPTPDVGTFVGWRDDFNDPSRVDAFSNVVFTGADVRLVPAGGLNRVGLMLGRGPPGDFDSVELGDPTVLFDQGIYRMWYYGSPGGTASIGYAESPDGRTWTKRGVVLAPSIGPDGAAAAYPEVVKVGAEYRMYYSGSDGSRYRILLATSSDGLVWTKRGVVLDVGPPGSGEDGLLFEASVVFQGGSYRMWYTGVPSGGGPDAIFLATSADGNSWARQGQVLSVGPPGSIDDFRVEDPTVRMVGSGFEMLYAAVFDTGMARIARASSTDGISWQKGGSVLDLLPPDEGSVLSGPFIHIEPDGSWKVYYQARGSSLQIFLATLPAPGPVVGWVRSQRITIPARIDWAWFNQTASVPQNAWLNLSVLDGTTGLPLPGLENVTAGPVDLRAVDSSAHPQLVLEARMAGNGSATPVLDSWETSWTDQTPPTFAGVEVATDLGTGGSVELSWSLASDPSPPILYRIYQASGLDPFDFGTPSYTDSGTRLVVTGLVNGEAYRFAVRAMDGWGNEDGNTASRTVIPTTPIDSTPPAFSGLTSALDARTGGAVQLSWSAGADPDTAESNSDPSVPVRYLVFSTRTGVPFNFGTPGQVTTEVTALVGGLTDGVSYDFLVRAIDAAGNAETNAIVRSATPTHPWDTTPPVFTGVDQVVDLGTGDGIRVTWRAASDPDTPESNVDPSLPIEYSVYISESASGVGSGPANATTGGTSIDLGGLRPGRTYYVLVRAMDGAGNLDSNTRIVSIQVREQAASLSVYGWAIAALILVAVLLVVLVAWRRRNRERSPPNPPAT